MSESKKSVGRTALYNRKRRSNPDYLKMEREKRRRRMETDPAFRSRQKENERKWRKKKQEEKRNTPEYKKRQEEIKIRRQNRAIYDRARTYKTSVDEIIDRYNKQECRCAICGTPIKMQGKGKDCMHIDHSGQGKHKTVRGLTCPYCNSSVLPVVEKYSHLIDTALKYKGKRLDITSAKWEGSHLGSSRNREYKQAYSIWKKYGLNPKPHRALYDRQGGRCAICGKPGNFKGKGNGVLYIDHCHEKKHVRGLLCSTCNYKIMGAVDKNLSLLRLADEYLKRAEKKRLQLAT